MRFVSVIAPDNHLGIVFLRAVGGPESFTIPARAVRRDQSGEARPVRPSGRKHQKGHAMLELAISAGVLVTCLAGTFQFGYTFYVYNQLVSAVGNGARYAAQRTYRYRDPRRY